MPYPNEHACRVRDPGDFTRIRRDNSRSPNVLYGYLKSGDSAVQAFRYPKARWTASAARRHCRRHNGSFEAASGSTEGLQHNSILAPKEPIWSSINIRDLPPLATVEGEYPHHWVNEDGELLLHRGGLVTAWRQAQDAGNEQVMEHLEAHLSDLGLTEDEANIASTVYDLFAEVLEGNVFSDLVVAKGLLQISTSEGGPAGISFNLGGVNHALVPEEFETALVEAVGPQLESLGVLVHQDQEGAQAVFDLVLTPMVRFPTPEGTTEEETVEVVDVKVPDHEIFLESLLEGLKAPEGIVNCEEILFQVPKDAEAEFTYQIHITGLEEKGRPAIYATAPCCRKIRWKVKGQDIVYGFTFPSSRLEEPDSLLTALEHEPIPVAYLRPPQGQEWFNPSGYVKPGEPGASKNRGACYLTEDTGQMRFGKQEPGYHELIFEGEKLTGRWALEYVPGVRGHEWVMSRIGE